MANSRFASIIILCTVAGSIATTAPIPTDIKKKIYYYPIIENSKWVYTTDSQEVLYVLTNVSFSNDFYDIILSQYVDGKEIEPCQKLRVSTDKIVELPSASEKINSCEKLTGVVLMLPFKEGGTWKYSHTGGTGLGPRESGVMAIYDEEEIEVPAGKFKALRVESSATVVNGAILTKELKSTSWYASGVGLIRHDGWDGKSKKLKSFTSGNSK